jgi:hypothetical protein
MRDFILQSPIKAIMAAEELVDGVFKNQNFAKVV